MSKNISWLGWLLLVPLVAVLHCSRGSNNNQEPENAVTIFDSVILNGLSHIWELRIDAEHYIWITERSGKVSRYNPFSNQLQHVLTIDEVRSRGEGGLLGLALHPAWTTTPQVFLIYNYEKDGDYLEKLVRYRWSESTKTLTDPLILLDQIPAASIHNGSRLLIIDNKLYVSTGDAADALSAQDVNSLSGKILRLNLDGSIPNDNPLPDNPIWSFGHRNVQGLTYAKNILYCSEHGPSSDDEINIIEKGRNYGWPEVEGLCSTPDENEFCRINQVKEPIKTWTPTIAPSGMEYYNSDRIPQWKNSLLLTTLKNQRLYQLKLNNSGTAVDISNEYYASKYGRLRAIAVSADGKIYLGSSNGNNDKIILIDRR